MKNTKIILALDSDDQRTALELVAQLSPELCRIKIGSILFTRYGPAFVRDIIAKGFDVFLDLKFHDIPQTVAGAVKSAADLGAWMLTVHASGGIQMLEAAVQAAKQGHDKSPLIMAVTVLTSLTANPADVEALALNAKQAGCDGAICSGLEAEHLRQCCGNNFLLATPGIRLEDDAANDQTRVLTPTRAITAGADYLVIGRSITQAKDPLAVLTKIHAAIINH